MMLLLTSTICPVLFFCYAADAAAVSTTTTESSIFQGLVESMVNETMLFVTNSLSSVIVGMFQFVDDADQCPLSCMGNLTLPEEMNDYMESLQEDWAHFRNQSSTTGINMKRLFDAPRLRMACGVYRELATCINTCQDRPWKRRLSEWLKPNAYVCDESNFVQYADCYRTVYEADKDHCNDKCVDEKRNLLTLFRKRLDAPHTMPSLLDYAKLTADEVKFTCDYITCKTKCRSRELVFKCGQDAESTLRTTYRYVLRSVKSINKFVFEALDAENAQKLVYADQCENF